MDGNSLAAEARGYAMVARKKEAAGNKEDARKFYLKAAKFFLEASKLSEGEKKALRRQMAEMFLNRAKYLKEEAKIGVENERESSKEKFLPIEKPNITFKDVGGLKSVKEEIRKAIIYPFKHPEIYEMYGKKAGESILLYGPPGCGKTYIAKAAAGECNASFISIKSSDVFSKWLGESEKNIRRVFEMAREYAPSILFIDEIDALGTRRGGTSSIYAKRVVNELLVALDGVDTKKENMLILAATNEPWAVDPALRRPGRFSKLIFVPPPDYEARIEIFKLHTKNRPLGDDIDFNRLAQLTDGYSAADIAQICEEAADIPLEEALEGRQPRKIEMKDFLEVIEKRKSSLTPWFKMAKHQIKKSGEEEIFKDLLEWIEKYE